MRTCKYAVCKIIDGRNQKEYIYRCHTLEECKIVAYEMSINQDIGIIEPLYIEDGIKAEIIGVMIKGFFYEMSDWQPPKENK